MTHIHLSPSEAKAVSEVLGIDRLHQMARSFAESYDADSGDSIKEFTDRAAADVYPLGASRFNGERANFKGLVRGYIADRQKAQKAAFRRAA